MTTAARLIREGELEELLRLYHYLQPNDPELVRGEELSALWKSMLENPGLYILVVEHEGVLVATCMLCLHKNLTRGARPFGLIENVVTHGDYRRRGFGRLVLEKAVETARLNNCYKVMLMSSADRSGAHGFYEDIGFDRGKKLAFTLYME